MSAVPTTAECLAIAAKWIADLLGATPTTPKVHLVSAPFTPTPTINPATLTEATFDGYAAKAITTWGTVHLDSKNQALFINTSPLDWTPTGSTTSNTIYGYYLLDSAGTVVQSETFNPPKVLDGTSTTLQLVISLAVAPWSVACTVLP